MEEGEPSNGFTDDWEQIHIPTLSTTHSNSFHDSTSPSTQPDSVSFHEPLEMAPQPDSFHEPLEMVPSDEPEEISSVGSNNGDEEDSGTSLNKANEVCQTLCDGVVRAFARVRCFVGFGSGIWPFGAIGGALAALLVTFVYAKMRRRRARAKEKNKDRLILLVQEKDQKINQLLLQVAHMKELMSARRRVPVLRVS